MKKKPAVFLDRDGVLCTEKSYITKKEDLEIFPFTKHCIDILHQKGFLAICITNQSAVARGMMTEETLRGMNDYLVEMTGLDALYYCPHHPERGFLGERIEYKKDCTCRKPKPGLLLEAAQKYNIDLAKSYMVGDSERDVIAGMAAGCVSVYIGNKELSDQRLDGIWTAKAVRRLCDC